MYCEFDNTIVLFCKCGNGEGIRLDADSEYLYISYIENKFSSYQENKYSLEWDALRHKPVFEIILDVEDISKLLEYLDRVINTVITSNLSAHKNNSHLKLDSIYSDTYSLTTISDLKFYEILTGKLYRSFEIVCNRSQATQLREMLSIDID